MATFAVGVSRRMKARPVRWRHEAVVYGGLAVTRTQYGAARGWLPGRKAEGNFLSVIAARDCSSVVVAYVEWNVGVTNSWQIA